MNVAVGGWLRPAVRDAQLELVSVARQEGSRVDSAPWVIVKCVVAGSRSNARVSAPVTQSSRSNARISLSK